MGDRPIYIFTGIAYSERKISFVHFWELYGRYSNLHFKVVYIHLFVNGLISLGLLNYLFCCSLPHVV
jgi:hypothetical protein